jgi:hypothetical protein
VLAPTAAARPCCRRPCSDARARAHKFRDPARSPCERT